MIWEFVLTVLTLLQGPSEDSPPNPVQFDPIQDHVHHVFSSDGIMLYNRKSPGPQTPQERELAGKALHRGDMGGDMLFSHVKEEDEPSDKFLVFNARSKLSDRWPGYPGSGTIPYVIHQKISKRDHPLIKHAIEQYNTQTCVKFVPRKKEKDYVRITKGAGCYSFIGKVGGAQELSLGDGCMYIGTIVHELGHALGFLHEHQRHDRDHYITVYEGNITAGLESQFNKTDRGDEIIYNEFDYNSIMIYGNYAFSRDKGLMTMEALNGQPLTDPFDKPGLDASDIERVNAMYECTH